jgi:regulator of protease activity HflC (stomatin/prohibitin superfamily)
VRIVISTRIRNQESAQLKVNDADGNPIEIAAVVVWQVADTASAIYSVDEVVRFVTIQTETAVRQLRPATAMTAAAAARCRCGTTPTRSPSGCRPSCWRASGPPECTSSRPA